jgi:molecular chaperone GrpE
MCPDISCGDHVDAWPPACSVETPHAIRAGIRQTDIGAGTPHETDAGMEHQQAQWDTEDEQREPADRDALRRALRDLEAAEQRVERTAQRVYEESKNRLVLDLLPLLDNLDHTIDHAGDTNAGPLLEAIHMLRTQMVTVLSKFGVSRIDTIGVRFDPSTMEAVAMVPVRDPRYAGIVIEQLAAAYRQGDRLVRPARVTVGQLTRR